MSEPNLLSPTEWEQHCCGKILAKLNLVHGEQESWLEYYVDARG
jgi:hypothetical protein